MSGTGVTRWPVGQEKGLRPHFHCPTKCVGILYDPQFGHKTVNMLILRKKIEACAEGHGIRVGIFYKFPVPYLRNSKQLTDSMALIFLAQILRLNLQIGRENVVTLI